MRSIIVLVVGLLLSLALGLWSAWIAVRSPTPVDAIALGSWQAWPNAGTAAVDPYSRARLARSGEIPLGSGEGLALLAQTDDTGARLSARCDYKIVGSTPPARLWTLAIEGQDGRLPGSAAQPAALGSDVILRTPDGGFEIAISPDPKSGNWISTEGAADFRVVVRLYDTTARLVTALTVLAMPQITRERCA